MCICIRGLMGSWVWRASSKSDMVDQIHPNTNTHIYTHIHTLCICIHSSILSHSLYTCMYTMYLCLHAPGCWCIAAWPMGWHAWAAQHNIYSSQYYYSHIHRCIHTIYYVLVELLHSTFKYIVYTYTLVPLGGDTSRCIAWRSDMYKANIYS